MARHQKPAHSAGLSTDQTWDAHTDGYSALELPSQQHAPCAVWQCTCCHSTHWMAGGTRRVYNHVCSTNMQCGHCLHSAMKTGCLKACVSAGGLRLQHFARNWRVHGDSPRHCLHSTPNTLLNVSVQRISISEQASFLATCCYKTGPEVLAVPDQHHKGLVACMQ